MRRLKSLVLIATIAFSADASSMEAGVDSQQIVIGQNITLQGGKNSYGVEVQAGAQLLLKNVNRAGGVYGRRITLRTLDDDNQSSKAEANTRQLIDEGAFAMIGSIEGGPSTAVMKAVAAKNVPFFWTYGWLSQTAQAASAAGFPREARASRRIQIADRVWRARGF